jgi:two-component system, LytTR family, response regulator LytT
MLDQCRYNDDAHLKLWIKAGSERIVIEIPKIALVEAMADYVRIHHGEKRHTVYSSMKRMAARLPEQSFMRIHRSYIVNLSLIDKIERHTIVVAGHVVPIGITYHEQVMHRIHLYSADKGP